MKNLFRASGVALAIAFAPVASAQNYLDVGGQPALAVVPISPGAGPLFTTANPGKVSGAFSATIGGFQPTPAYSQLAVGAASTRVALPSGVVVIVYNTGAQAASVLLGNTSVIATANNDQIPAGGWMAFAVGSNVDIAGIESSGAGPTNLVISGGSGLPTGAGAGGASGSGGTVNQGTAAAPTSAWPFLQVIGSSAVSTANPVPIAFGTGVTLPAFAATPTVNLGTLNGAATASNQTNGNQKSQIVDGSGNVIGSTSNALNVNCANCSSGGGGSGGGATPQTTASLPISVSSATTTSIITHVTGDFTYITQFNINTPSTGTVQLEYGTGALCGTGTTVITGQYSLATQGGISLGSGFGAALTPIPVSNDVCMITTGGSVNAQGSVSYTQSSTPLSSFGGGGGGLSVVDQTVVIPGTSPMTPIGCFATASPVTLTNGDQGMVACNPINRSLFVDVLAGSNFANLLGVGTFATGSPQTMPTSVVGVGGQDINGKGVAAPIDPCDGPKSYAPDLRITTGSAQLVAGISGKKIYICAGSSVKTDQDNNLSLVEGTGSNCGTGTASVYDNDSTSISAAHGQLYLRGGGIQLDGKTPAATQVAGDALCEFNTTTNSPNVHTHIVYVQE